MRNRATLFQQYKGIGQNVQAVELGGIGAGDGAESLVSTLGHFFGTAGGIVEGNTYNAGIASEEPAALGETLGVAEIARFAPSACNSQPWYVKNEGGALTVFR